MKLFTSEQIRHIDSYTIANEPVKSIDLMERAAGALFAWFIENIERTRKIIVLAGPGNNGGDGLALSRLLAESDYRVEVYHICFTDKYSVDRMVNYERLTEQALVEIKTINTIDELPYFSSEEVLVDSIFGTGLTRPATGLAAEVISRINESDNLIVSVDIPSGLFGEDNSANTAHSIIRAKHTLSFQFPKLSFFFAGNHQFVGKYHILPIGLHPSIIRDTMSVYNIIDDSLVASIVRLRKKFDHKGVFGHGLMVAGSCGKTGAAVLSSLAALRTGIGLLTTHVPRSSADIIHTSVPETMVQCDQSDILISEIYDTEKYSAIGIGPGLGTKPNTGRAVSELLKKYHGPLVIDADALNIISENKELLRNLPENAILTPHPGEFARLSGSEDSGFRILQKQIELSVKYNCIIILKGANTSISLSDGRVWFNSTGNPGMATAGSGDVLTGMILSMLAQGYTPADSAIAAVYLHGLAGDIAAEKNAYESLIASDIIHNIGKSFRRVKK